MMIENVVLSAVALTGLALSAAILTEGRRQTRRLQAKLLRIHVEARLARDRGYGSFPVRTIFEIVDPRDFEGGRRWK